MHTCCARRSNREGKAGGRGEREAAAGGRHVGDMIGNESVGASQNLPLGARMVEAKQAVGGSNLHRACLRISQNAVDAKYVLVFHVDRAAAFGRDNVETSIEKAYPDSAARVCCQCGNIAIAKRRCTGVKYTLPSKSMSIHAVEATASHGEQCLPGSKKLADF